MKAMIMTIKRTSQRGLIRGQKQYETANVRKFFIISQTANTTEKERGIVETQEKKAFWVAMVSLSNNLSLSLSGSIASFPPNLCSLPCSPNRLSLPSAVSTSPNCVVRPKVSTNSVSESWFCRGGFPSSSVKRRALGDSSDARADSFDNPTVYRGVYGPWTVDPSDVREVILYRSGLVTSAVSFVAAASAAFLPENFFLSDLIKPNLDVFYAIGAGGLGLSLLLIHIYITEIKRTLQVLWVLGVIGSLAAYTSLAKPAGEDLVHYVTENPTAVWFVGPLFAALTGLVFKEGLCYGKLEAGILTFIIPSILLGHLTGLMDDNLKLPLLGVWMMLFVVFAGRKFTQPIKDDIGDKSIFMFNSLSEEEKKALVDKLEQQNYTKKLS